MDIAKTPVDIKTLIQTSSIEIYDKTKLIEKLQNHFTDEEQRLYVCNLFLYLNYHPVNDFIINLDNVWKFIGFSNKANAKRLLKHNFKEDIDYKKLLIHTDEQVENIKDEKNISSDKAVIRTDDGKFKNETIMLNINTFKKLCLKANTENADKIHDYYIKLEMVYNELMKEEIEETKKQLKEKDKLIDNLDLRPETEGFNSRESGEIYCIRDNSKPGHFKIGMANKSITRVDQLNVGSSTQCLDLYMKYETFDRVLGERLIHHLLLPFRIKKRKEWFYFKNDLELAYAMNTIKKSLDYINNFNINSYTQFKEITKNLNVQKELTNEPVIKKLNTDQVDKNKEHIEKIRKKNINSSQQSPPKTGTFKGVCWCPDKNLWYSQLTYDHKHFFLGYFSDEIDGAKIYNDYALYLNNTKNCNFLLNEIPGYKTIPRNIPELNKIMKQEKKSSIYTGVSYDTRRKYYVAGIRFSGKTYNLGFNLDETECAKLYNQQALYFNKTFNTTYVLNDIKNYITEPKNISYELKIKKENNKTSKYIGVSLTSTNKWCCSYMLNRKKIHIGTFDTELEACKAYNETIIKLNANGCNYKINKILEE
jgi:hypothetical protein